MIRSAYLNERRSPFFILFAPLRGGVRTRDGLPMGAAFTAKQGQYLAFIHNYSMIHSVPPAEADIQRYFNVTPPTVHQMILRLQEKGLITRAPGQARTVRVLLDPNEIPRLGDA